MIEFFTNSNNDIAISEVQQTIEPVNDKKQAEKVDDKDSKKR